MGYEMMLFNSLIHTVGFYWVLSAFLLPCRYTKAICFFTMLIIFGVSNFIFAFVTTLTVISLALFICYITATFFINIRYRNLFKSYNTAVSLALFFQISMTLFMWFVQVIDASFGVILPFSDVALQIWFLCCAVLLHKGRRFFFHYYDDKKLLVFHAAFKTAFFLAAGIGLPFFRVASMELMYAAASLFLVLITAGAFFYVKHITALENQNRRVNDMVFRQHIESENMNKRYEEMIAVKHYYTGLYRSTVGLIEANNMPGLRAYYHEHIAPIHKQLHEETSNYKSVDYIGIALVRARIIELINAVSMMPHIRLTIDIGSTISDVQMKERDLFTILNIFIDNAVEETCRQDKGEIRIYMAKVDNTFAFKIENSLKGFTSSPKPHNTHKGLEIVKNITSNYSNIRVDKRVAFNAYTQVLEVSNE